MSAWAVRLLSLLVLATAAVAPPALAQSYPQRVVRIVNPFPPGGSVDTMARILAQKLGENLGQQVIVDNRAGAGGNVGAEAVAKAEPDGHTLLFTAPGPLVVNQTLFTKGLPFDPMKDFAPIALFGTAPIVLMVHPSVPANNVQELIALARKQPGKLHFASAGPGSTNHLSGELFKSMAKIDIVHVPYRGAGPAMNDLVGGHVQMFFDLLPVAIPQIRGGKVRALANAGAKRPSALPELATMAEQGLAGFDSSSWYGLVAPARTPDAVVARLADETRKVLQSPEVISRIRELGSEPGTLFRAEFAAFMRKEAAKWSEIIRISGATAE
ncbi:MAG: tripartite tricarboxylate transporter substrate binding protein [Hyphomicrobiales bacterium]|nr:tripartite tricarboxylate transporter substrate binding protein [Hyphomicrobiales bacterium]